MITFIKSKGVVSAKQIAERFNLSERTVYRDLRALQEQGISIGHEPGEGYFMGEGTFLTPVMFTDKEAKALLLMEGFVEIMTDLDIHRDYVSAINKIKEVMLQSDLKRELKDLKFRLPGYVKIQVPECMKVEKSYLGKVERAIASKQIVEIEYKDAKDNVTQRKLEPVGLVYYAMAWHMIGWCHLRKDYRDFKLHRIASFKNTKSPFSREHNLSMEEHMQNLLVEF
jgi:predicted DNA-binding transcriptional regulator YafY